PKSSQNGNGDPGPTPLPIPGLEAFLSGDLARAASLSHNPLHKLACWQWATDYKIPSLDQKTETLG
ncbi:Hypothetical predicted protein, partial [Pelobates cultripes]